MAEYKLSRVAEEDLIRIYHFGVKKFGVAQAEKYHNKLFVYFEVIAKVHMPLKLWMISKLVTADVCGSDSIFYRIKNEQVEIMTIIGQQDLDNISLTSESRDFKNA